MFGFSFDLPLVVVAVSTTAATDIDAAADESAAGALALHLAAVVDALLSQRGASVSALTSRHAAALKIATALLTAATAAGAPIMGLVIPVNPRALAAVPAPPLGPHPRHAVVGGLYLADAARPQHSGPRNVAANSGLNLRDSELGIHFAGSPSDF